MTSSDEIHDRLNDLSKCWPVGSMVESVMSRIESAPVDREALASRRSWKLQRIFAGLAASGLAASLILAWVLIASQPATLLASVQEGLEKAQSAHLVISAWDDKGAAHPVQDIWYRRGQGLRYEAPGKVIVEDGKNQWSWQTSPDAANTRVFRQRSAGFFLTGIASKLSLPEIRGDWTKYRTPERDQQVDGRSCQGFTISLADLERLPQGTHPVDGQEHRALILAETSGRINVITLERRPPGGSWQREREIRIAYDVPVPAEKLAFQPPDGAQVIDADGAFESLYPLDRALHRVELGGLVLAVHDLWPLKDREGVFVVSSVRGTREFLASHPPRRRPIHPELTLLDVAFQPMGNQMWGTRYDLVVMGSANREGVEYSWWIVLPRRFYMMRNGQREFLPETETSALAGEPGRLDDLPGRVRIPLSATYWGEDLRDANGVQKGVSTWAEVLLPPGRGATTLDAVCRQTRHDLQHMSTGGSGLLGVAADARGAPLTLRPLSHFSPDGVTDGEFAAAVRRGIDDFRQLDEVRTLRPEDMLPPTGRAVPGP